MNINLNEIRLVRLPVKKPSKEERDFYLKTYDSWVKIWQIEKGKMLETQDFTAHDQIISLFYQEECVGFCFIKINPTDIKNSSLFLRKFKNLMMCYDFTLSHKFRKIHKSSPWRDIFFYFLVEEFKNSSSEVLISKISGKGSFYAEKKFGALKFETPLGNIMALDKNELVLDKIKSNLLLENALNKEFCPTKDLFKKTA